MKYFRKTRTAAQTSNRLSFFCRVLLFLLIVSLPAISCSDMFSFQTGESSLRNSSETDRIIFNGTISVSGAFPAALSHANEDCHTELDSASQSSVSRSAIPSFTIGTEYYYYVTATQTDGSGSFSTNSIDDSKVFDTTSGVTFFLELTNGNWKIECGIKKAKTLNVLSDDDLLVMSDTYTATLSAANPVVSHIFYPMPTKNGKGDVALQMTFTGVSKITIACSDEKWASDTISPEEDKATLGKTGLDSGTYEVTINFYDSNGNLLYYTVQSINVFDNMTTNSWVSDGSGVISSDGVFNLTSTLISQFSRTTFYVGQTEAATSLNIKASDKTGTGSVYSPLESVTKAASIIAAAGDISKDYRIYVCGTVKGAQEISSAVNGKANSITIQGYNGLDENLEPKDALDGNNSGSTLTHSSSVPVTIKNLKITGGSGKPNGTNTLGGGIYIDSGKTLSLGDGALVTSNTAAEGGGIYNAGKLYLYGSAMVGKKTDTVATSISYGNKATVQGAGIYSDSTGSLYLGYKSEEEESELTGGVCGNYNENATNSSAKGGGIYNYVYTALKTLKIASGNISYNYSLNGAGIYTNGFVTMSGGTIEGNEGNSSNTAGSGGGVYVTGRTTGSSNFSMSGNSQIKNNKNMNYGAGIYLYYDNCKLVMNGGEISGNIAETHGGAVYMHDYNSSSHSDLQISGSSYIPYGGAVNNNDIYMLDTNVRVTIKQSLSARDPGNVIGITPNSYTEGRTLLTAADDVILADELDKFRVTPDSQGKEWSIDSYGKLFDDIVVSISKDDLSSFTPNSSTAYTIIVDSSFGKTEVESLLSKISGKVGEGTILDLGNSTATSISTSSTYWLTSGVSSITLPATLSSRLGSQFFQNADTLTEIIVPESNTIYCSQDGVLYTKDMTGLMKYPPAKEGDSFTLPETVYQLYYEAFYNNKNLTTINGLTQIRSFIDNESDAVFSSCEKLEEIDLSGLTCNTLYDRTIRYSSALRKVTLSSSITTIDFACFQYLSNLEEVHFNSTTPPLIKTHSSDPSYYINFKSCPNVKFYVPSEAVEAYQNATGDNGICNPNYNGAATTTAELQALIIGE